MPYDTQHCELQLGSYSIRAIIEVALPSVLRAEDYVLSVTSDYYQGCVGVIMGF